MAKINLNKEEYQRVAELRAWNRTFKTKGRWSIWSQFVVFAPPVLVVFSAVLMLINSSGQNIEAVFLCIGILGWPFMLKALKRYKKIKLEVLSEMVKEEHDNSEVK